MTTDFDTLTLELIMKDIDSLAAQVELEYSAMKSNFEYRLSQAVRDDKLEIKLQNGEWA